MRPAEMSAGQQGMRLTENGSMAADNPGQTKATRQVQITNRLGLHARPAMQFVEVANRFSSQIRVLKNEQTVNAKSIMELLLLAATAGTDLTIDAEGDDAPDAVDALAELVERGFDEE